MSILTNWLGQPKKRSTNAGDFSVKSFQPRVESLEERAVPDATIVTQQQSQTDTSGTYLPLPADAPVQTIGSSSNGRYLLLQSKATNLISVQNASGTLVPQVSAPGQTNIFWLQRNSDGTNNIKLVSAYDPDPAFDNTFVPGQKGLGVAESVPGQYLNAVLSDDGQSVAFLSGTNAALFDANLYSTRGFGIDGGGQDAFFWQASTNQVTLASRDRNGFALGASGAVTNPSISPDGKVVTFVSDYNAQAIAGRASYNNRVLIYDDNNSPDIFRFDTTSTTSLPEPVSVNQVFFYIDTSGNVTDDLAFFMHGYQSNGIGVKVDPLGRYVTAGGAGFIGLRPSGVNGNFDAFRYTTDGTIPTLDNSPYPISNANTNLNNFNFFFQSLALIGSAPTNLLPTDVTTVTSNFVTSTSSFTAVDTGSVVVNNAIVALYSGDVLVTFNLVAPITNSKLVFIPGYTPSASATGTNRFDIMQRGFFGSTLQYKLLSKQAGTTNQGIGFLDLNPGAYSITPDATKMLYTSAAVAGLAVTDAAQLALGPIVDTNQQFDIFQVDNTSVNNTSLISVRNSVGNATGLGASRNPSMTPDGIAIAFESTVLSDEMTDTPDQNGSLTDIYVRDRVQKQTLLASGIPANVTTGNGASVTPVVVRNSQANAQYYRNFEVLFTSSSTDLQSQIPVDATIPQVYAAAFPIFISSLPRSVSFSGGEGGFVSISRLDNQGNVISVSKLQPFKGYTGDLRVATADFNGDGTPDVAIGAGPGGGPRVSVVDGFTLRVIQNFFAFESAFTGGVYVAAGDLNNDGTPELVVGAGELGGPRLQIYNATTGQRTFDQFAYESSSRTGVHVATGDYNGDGTKDVVIGAGAGGGPRVRVLSGKGFPNQVVLADFFAFDSGERNGVNVDAADFNGDGLADIAVGSGNGSPSRVIVYNAAYQGLSDPNYPAYSIPVTSPLYGTAPVAAKFVDFVPFPDSDSFGARVVLRNIEGGQFAGLVVSSAGQLPQIKTYSGARRGLDSLGTSLAPQQLKEFIPFNSAFGDGAWVG
jgi:FG-GAP-like repeat/FG-GAP repeat/WD40-like Beta Propeller Repeat